MKSFLKILIPAIATYLVVLTALAAPVSNLFRNIAPESDLTYESGTSTPAARWLLIYTQGASTTNLTAFNRLLVGGTATTSIFGNNSTSTYAGGINILGGSGGCFAFNGTCLPTASGITSLNGLTGATQTFSANGPLAIVSAGTVHTFNASSSPYVGTLTASSTIHASSLILDTALDISSYTNLAVTGGLIVLSNDTLSGSTTPTFSGLTSTSTLKAEGNTTLGGTLIVSGLTTMAGFISTASSSIAANFNIAGPLSASSTLSVTGATTLAGGLTLTCTSCITDTNVSDTLTASDLVAGSEVVADTEVVDTITLTNITQITNRAITDTTGTLTVARGGTNATSFTTSGNAVYYNGTSLLTAPLGTSITIPYATTTGISSSQGATFATVSGNVGIGTITPEGSLHIKGGDGDQTLTLEGGAGAGKWHWSVTAAKALNLAETGVANNRLLVAAGGKIGIGTSSPGTIFAISGATPRINIYDSVNTGTISIYDNSDGDLTIEKDNSAFIYRTLGVTRFKIANTGGVTMPGLSGGAAGDEDVCKNPTSSELTDANAASCIVSSILYKENIKQQNNALLTISALNPVIFTYKPELDHSLIKGVEHYGLIAEEVEKVDKRLIGYELDNKTPRTVRYEEMVSVVVQAIKELYADFQKLVAKVSGQDERIEKLEAKVKDLELRLKKAGI